MINSEIIQEISDSNLETRRYSPKSGDRGGLIALNTRTCSYNLRQKPWNTLDDFAVFLLPSPFPKVVFTAKLQNVSTTLHGEMGVFQGLLMRIILDKTLKHFRWFCCISTPFPFSKCCFHHEAAKCEHNFAWGNGGVSRITDEHCS